MEQEEHAELFQRLPEALLSTHILSRVGSLGSFSLGQTSCTMRDLVFGASAMTSLWESLDLDDMAREREEQRAQHAQHAQQRRMALPPYEGGGSGPGGPGAADAAAAAAAQEHEEAEEDEREQLALLLLRLLPPLLRSFKGPVTDAVLHALLAKFSCTLQALLVSKLSAVSSQPLLSLARGVGPNLRVLRLSCPFELQPGFLYALASNCPRLSQLCFSPATRVTSPDEAWTPDPGMRTYGGSDRQVLQRQLQQQLHRHAFTLELFKLMARCPELAVLHLAPGIHCCNAVLLYVRRLRHLRQLQAARTNFSSGEGLAWPDEVAEEYAAYRRRQRAASGLPPLSAEDELRANEADTSALRSKYLSDLTWQTFDDMVKHLSSRDKDRAGDAVAAAAVEAGVAAVGGCVRMGEEWGAVAEPSSAMSAGPGVDEHGGRVVIDDVAGRRLRIDMQYHATWGAAA